ncbi:MAG: amidohydrolase family protein, partial [Defluviitaleaceae bacterium]|nr:amidohydrolase family protein [Defluviitaleaceae bacterium]
MALNIINARVVSDGAVRENQTISIDGGTIKNVGERGAISGRTLDAGGLYASAGFIDIHTHGAGGADYMDATEDAFLTAGRASAHNGATTVYPTTMSASNEELFEVFNAFERFRQTKYEGADMPGLHLEGPYFSPRQSGAQDPEYVRAPEPAEYEKILGYGRLIKRWSAAPELQGALEFGKKLSDQGILPAIAHSDASLSELRLALAYGYRLVTHFYCCVSALRYQDGKCRPGIVEGSFLLDDVYIECIGDGIHVVPDLLHM